MGTVINFIDISVDILPVTPDTVRRVCAWCQKFSTHRLTRISKFTGNRFERDVCDNHAQDWRDVSESQGE